MRYIQVGVKADFDSLLVWNIQMSVNTMTQGKDTSNGHREVTVPVQKDCKAILKIIRTVYNDLPQSRSMRAILSLYVLDVSVTI